MSLAQQAEFQRFAKKSRRERFLEEMDAVMPWAELVGLVAPYYAKGETGLITWWQTQPWSIGVSIKCRGDPPRGITQARQ